MWQTPEKNAAVSYKSLRVGPVVTVDPKTNTVLGPEAAAKLFKGPYRKEFTVPTIG